MRSIVVVILVLIGVFAVDTLALDGRYTRAAWSQAKVLGDKVRAEVDGLFKRGNL
jgi:hypothetical protein